MLLFPDSFETADPKELKFLGMIAVEQIRYQD